MNASEAERSSRRPGSLAVRRILWVAAVLVVPVPLLVVGPGLVPAGRLLELGAVSLALLLAESHQGVVGILTALLLGQGLLWVGVWWLAALVVAGVLARARRAVLLSLAATALLVTGALLFEIYETPFAAERPRASLLHVYR